MKLFASNCSFWTNRQNTKPYDPQNPQPVKFRTSPILLLKYETIRKQLTVVFGQNVKIQSRVILKICNQWNFAKPYILLLKYETFRKQR